MYFVTYCNIWLKCYITFCDIVADGKRCSNVLAIAINDLWLIILKNIKKYYSTFLTFTIVSPSMYSTVQFTESPISTPKNFITSFGMVVLPDKLFGLAIEIFDSYSNTFIPPILFFVIYNYIHIIYIIFST